MQEASSILADLKKKNYKPIYFLFGTEALYIDKVVEFIEHKVLTESEQSFNQTTFYGRDSEPSNIVEVCSRLPMMSSHQVVIVKEAQELKSFDYFDSYFKKPVPSTILVFAYKHKKVDKRKTVFKNLLKNENVVSLESNVIRDYEVAAWITKYAKQKKIEISPKGVQLLAEFLGTDLSKITHELDKLLLVKGENASISEVDIEKNIGISKEYNIFELNNALGEKNPSKTYKIVNYFIANPKSLFLPMAIGTVYTFFTKLFLVKYAGNADSRALGSILRINPFIAKNYLQYAAHYDMRQIKNIFDILKEYDLKSKGMGATGATTPGELLKEMVAKILN
ncbi:MAG: DNA polymerase III subunit delta [Chitinophagales bacterium]